MRKFIFYCLGIFAIFAPTSISLAQSSNAYDCSIFMVFEKYSSDLRPSQSIFMNICDLNFQVNQYEFQYPVGLCDYYIRTYCYDKSIKLSKEKILNTYQAIIDEISVTNKVEFSKPIKCKIANRKGQRYASKHAKSESVYGIVHCRSTFFVLIITEFLNTPNEKSVIDFFKKFKILK